MLILLKIEIILLALLILLVVFSANKEASKEEKQSNNMLGKFYEIKFKQLGNFPIKE